MLVKLGSIGDVVNTLPLVNVVRESWPDTELAWVIEPESHSLVEGHPAVDRFIVFRRERGLSGAKRALGEIRAFKPDLVIDLQRILRSSFFAFFSGSPRRLGFDRRRCKECSWIFTNMKIPAAEPSRHMVFQYLEFADYLGLNRSKIKFGLPLGGEDHAEAEASLPSGALREGFIALNLGAAKPANRWPVERWAQLARLIVRGSGYFVVLTGGSRDRRAGEECGKGAGTGERLTDLTGRTSLKSLAAVFARSQAVVSGDTGPMHIASALGRITIGLFGPADPRRTGPFNYPDLVVCSRLDCGPCGKRNCGSRKCMEEISAAEVWERLLSAICDSNRCGKAGRDGRYPKIAE